MVAIVGGNGLGLLNSSAALLGQRGLAGNALQGQNGESVYVNASTGNLVIQHQDDFLASVGIDIAVGRTYNSQGKLDDDNGDNWKLGLSRQVTGLTGTANAAGSTVERVDGDGTRYKFTYDSSRSMYVSTDGGNAFDTLSYDAATKVWTWQSGSTDLSETYDGANGGRLASMLDLDGNRLTFNYQANGLLASVTDATGAGTFFTYAGASGKNLMSAEVRYRDTADGPLKVSSRVSYTYDSQNRLAQVTTALSANSSFTTKYTYDGASNRIATIEQTDGSKLTFTYQGDRVATVSDGKYESETFTYAGTQTTVTDKDGTITRYDFNGNGQILHMEMAGTNAASLHTYFEYDAQGNVTKMVEPNGNTITRRYDARGNATNESDSTGRVFVRTYSDNNLLLDEMLNNDATSYYIYDAREHLRFVIDGDRNVQEYRYDQRGQRSATIAYAKDFYSSAVVNPNESQLVNWVAGIDKTRALRTDYGYDIRGRLATATTYTDLASDGTGIRNGTESVARFTYDQAGQLLSKIDGKGHVTSYVYDGMGRLLTTVDPGANSVVTTREDIPVQRIVNGVSTLSTLSRTTYPNGRVSETTFDTAGRTLAVVEKSGSAVLSEVYYGYDAEGRLAMVQDANGNRNFTLYDSLNRKSLDIDSDGSVVEYKYNAKGLVSEVIQHAERLSTSLRTPSLATSRPAQLDLKPGSADVHEWRFYDAAGRLTDTVDGAGNVTSTVYDKAGRVLAQIQRFNVANISSGSPTGVPVVANDSDRIHRYLYKTDGKLAGEVDAAGYLTEYVYNAAEQLVETVRYAGAEVKPNIYATWGVGEFRPSSGSPSHANDIHEYNLYDAKGQLVAEIDGQGYVTVHDYDAAGNLGRSVRYANPIAYKSGQTLVQVLPQVGNDTQSITYTYDTLDHVSSVTGVDGSVTRYEYDAVGNRTSTTAAAGTAGARGGLVRYDALGRVTAELSGVGAAQLALAGTSAQQEAVWTSYAATYTYDKANHRTTMTDANGHVTRYYYDQDGRLAATVNAAGEVEQRTYNAINQVTSLVRYAQRIDGAELGKMTGGEFGAIEARLATLRSTARDYVATYAYDATGRMTSRTDETGTHVFTYDTFNEVVLDRADIGDGRTAQTRYTYTARGELLAQEDLANAQTGAVLTRSVITRDAFGRVIYSKNDNTGSGDTYAYDKLGRLVSVVSATGTGKSTVYDAFDRVVKEIDTSGGVTTYSYDTAARKMTMTTAEGVVHSVVRNAFGDVAELIDANGDKTTYTYDQDGNLKSVSDKLGTSEAHDYDRAGNMVTTTDGNGSVTRFEYDSVDRVLRRTVDVGGLNLVTSYTYDAQGRTLTVTDPTGAITATTYDSLGRVQTAVQSAEQGGLALTTSFAYDKLGRTVRTTDPAGRVVEYQYDLAGRRTATIADPDGLKLKTTYDYDSLGTAPFRSTDANGNITHYIYDQDGRKVGEIDGAGDVTVYAYEAGSDRIASVTRYARPLMANFKKNFDNAGKRLDLATVRGYLEPDANRDNVTTYLYDKDGRLHFTVEGDRSVTQQRYDNNGRVAQTTQYAVFLPSNVALTDAAVSAWAPANVAGSISVSSVYDVRGQVLQQTNAAGGVTKYRYDGNGNVVSARTSSDATGPVSAKHMLYDAAGRLVGSATVQNFDNAAAYWSVSKMAYDGAGRMTERVDYATLLSDNTVVLDPTQAQLAQWLASVSANPAADAHARMSYDGAGRMVVSAVAQRGNADGLQWSVTRQEFDADGNVTGRTAYANFLAGTADGSLTDAQVKTWLAGAADATRDSTTRYVYDKANRLGFTIDALGSVVRREYDGAGNVRAETAYANPIRLAGTPTQEAVLKALETRTGALLSNLDGDRVTRYQYDAANRVSVKTDAVGVSTAYTYDGAGHLVREIENSGAATQAEFRVHRTVYGADGIARLSIDPEGYVTETRYNALGLVSDSIRYTTQTVIGDDQSVASVLSKVNQNDVQNRRTQYQYDNQGNLVASIDPMGKSDLYTYDALGRKTAYTNRNGATWTYVYDVAGHLLVERAPAVTVSEGSGVGKSVQIETRMTYDAFGHLTSRIEGVGGAGTRTTRYAYDLAGRQVKTILPQVAAYDYAADPLSAASNAGYTKAVDPTTTVTYDALGNAIEGTDVYGNVSRKVYDALGRVAYDIDQLGNVTAYEYNAFGEVEKLTRYAEAINAPVDPDKAAREDIAKIYAAFYNRAPDGGGVNFWLAYLKSGHTMAELADKILEQKESLYYNLPGMELPSYVARLFNDTYERAPTQAETDYWVKIGGEQGMTRGKLMLRIISEVPAQRDRDVFANKMDDFLHPWVLSAPRYRVSLLYTAILGHAPTATQLLDGMTYLAGGGNEAGLAHVLFDSAEGKTLYPVNMSTAAFITALSQNALGRAPGADLNAWVTAADAAPTRTQAVLDFLQARTAVQGNDDRFNLEIRAKKNMPANTQVYGAVSDYSLASVRSAIELHMGALDRVVDTLHDGLGRAIKVAESASYYYTDVTAAGSANPAMGYASLRKVTSFAYNAFGDAVERKEYAAGGDYRDAKSQVGEAAVTRMYYDRRGFKTAEFVAADTLASNKLARDNETRIATETGGYLTRTEYDAFGNLSRTYEYAQRSGDPGLAATSDYTISPTSPAVTDNDRDTRYAYDLDERKLSEQRLNVAYNTSAQASTRGTLTTTYTYDNVGNLTSTKDPLLNKVRTLYDALGRVTRILNTIDGSASAYDSSRSWIITDFARDSLGNVVRQTAYSQYQTIDDAGNSTLKVGADDRVTINVYDANGNVTGTIDANGSITWHTYDQGGRVAKEWQTVTDHTSKDATVTLNNYKVFRYDATGQMVSVTTPDSTVAAQQSAPGMVTGIVDKAAADIGRNVQTLTYNSFGEVTSRAMNGNVYEFAEYDNAGHAWHTNVGDGVTKVTYYDIHGNLTQQVTGTNRAGDSLNDLRLYTSAKDVRDAISATYLEVKGFDTVENRYDLMGRMLLHKDAQRVDGTVKLADGQPASAALRTPTTHTKYDRWGNVLEVTDPRNVNWRMEYGYNALNEQTTKRLVSFEQGETELSSQYNYYDRLGRSLGSRDSNGNLTSITYANDGSSTTTFADGTTEVSSLNLFGERISLKARDGMLTSYAYDHMGQMISMVRKTTDLYYAGDFYGTHEMEALIVSGSWDIREEYAYDEMGRRYRTTSYAQQGTTRRPEITNITRYDLAGNVIAQIDNAGNRTRWVYDAYGHKTAEMDGAGKTMSWQSDAFGHVMSHVDQGGATVQYQYDGQGHLIYQESTARQNTGAQKIFYTYDYGLLARIDDQGVGLVTVYKYDLAGNHVLEQTISTAGQVLTAQNNRITYDAYGRMSQVEDDFFKVNMEYDSNGNRTRVTTHYVNSNKQAVDTDVWNTYDSMNREVIANGIKANGSISMGSKGHSLTYDSLGRRATDTYYYKNAQNNTVPTTERFAYDTLGRLATVTRDGVVIEERFYDEFGRVVKSGPKRNESESRMKELGVPTNYKTYHYNAAGKVDRIKLFNLKADKLDDIYYRPIQSHPNAGYDGAGNLIQYVQVPADSLGNASRHSEYTTTYTYFDSAKEVQVVGKIDKVTQTTITTLDANGSVIGVIDNSATNKNRTFINDAAGRVLLTNQGGKTERTLIVNGEVLGSNSDQADPSNFANGYQSALSGANLASPTIHYVQQGDTLKSIAKAVWGDANLWYLIANANNLDVDSVLTEGQTLKLPPRANVVHNDAGTFTPYNAQQAIGDTSPTLPLPPAQSSKSGGSCAKKLIVAAVSIAVVWATSGLGSFVAGALGSVAGQVTGIALGVRDSFSWGEVFTSAVGNAVTGGLGKASSPLDAAKNAAISNAVSQGVGVVVGVQDRFDWKGVVASAISAGVSSNVASSRMLSGINEIARSTIAQTAGQTVATVATGGKLELKSIVADAFGNALGTALGKSISTTIEESRANSRLIDTLNRSGTPYVLNENGRAIADPRYRASFNFVQGAVQGGATLEQIQQATVALADPISRLDAAPGDFSESEIGSRVAHAFRNDSSPIASHGLDQLSNDSIEQRSEGYSETINGEYIGPSGQSIISETVLGASQLLSEFADFYSEHQLVATATYAGIKAVIGGGPVKTVAMEVARVSLESAVGDVTGAISTFAQIQARDYVTDLAERKKWNFSFSVHGYEVEIGPNEIGRFAGNVVGSVVDTVLNKGVDALVNRGITVNNIIERQQVGPHTVGSYSDVQGHHPHQQASRSNNENYNPRNAVAVADDGTYNHDAISAEQRRLNAEYARTQKVYTLEAEEKIQVEAMIKGGIKRADAEEMLRISREELQRQDALNPTRTPGTRRGK
ncbi:LysM peptidoglycan-binding domain-containing protein [Massilia forsythiae]|uniref:LysM peptidoglycan-binding domain-containing protein n=1 Tax=Massilia forsythiae TaxID=2728020 RepID=A0A7Z2ZRR1_9BURK|nr:LysM peptidoglycan-binding domain-containing protein [Massilia forsythiae]QJD99468.1 LysM peptidoglycan-binding domain-containing protein [Massilia forsythiae]